MSTSRAVTSTVLQFSRTSIPRCPRQLRVLPRPRYVAPLIIRTSQFRPYSQQPKPSRIYSFADVKTLSEKPDPNRILIDTREPGELQSTGTIPGSINIPVTSKPDSFFISAEEFEDRFGFERPSKEQEVVFYCRAGVRSRAAAELAKQAGWEKVSEFPGSWLDWEKNGGTKEGGR